MGCGRSHFVPDGKAIRTAEQLGFSDGQVALLARFFGRLDPLKEKRVTNEAVVRELRLKQGKELAMVVFRMGGHDHMTFTEFIISCFMLCTQNSKMMARLALSLFDLDGTGDLSAAEIAFVGYFLWNFEPSHGVAHAMQVLEKTNEQIVSLDEYCDPHSANHSDALTLHVVEMQLAFRTGTLGMRCWDQLTELRLKTHGSKSVFQILMLSSEDEVMMKMRGLARLQPTGVAAHPQLVVLDKLERCRRVAGAENRELAHKHDLHEKKKAQDKNSTDTAHKESARKDKHEELQFHDPHLPFNKLPYHGDDKLKSISKIGASSKDAHFGHSGHSGHSVSGHSVSSSSSSHSKAGDKGGDPVHRHAPVTLLPRHDKGLLIHHDHGHAHSHGHDKSHGNSHGKAHGHKHDEDGGRSHGHGQGQGHSHGHGHGHHHDEPHDVKHAMAAHFHKSSHHDAAHAHTDAHRQHDLQSAKKNHDHCFHSTTDARSAHETGHRKDDDKEEEMGASVDSRTRHKLGVKEQHHNQHHHHKSVIDG